MSEGACVVATLAIAAACAGGAAALAGCTEDNCDPTTVWLGNPAPPNSPPGVSSAPFPARPSVSADGTTWESSPISGPWIDFPGQVTDVIFPLENDGGPFVGPYLNTLAYVGPDSSPNAVSNYTLASGNLAEFFLVGGDPGTADGFNVHNDTCAQYYMRVVITRSAPTNGGATDGGTSADADGATDASDAGDGGVE